MRKKSALLAFAAAGTIVLSTVATTLPASAAPITSLKVSSSMLSTRDSGTRARSFPPDSAGAVVCEGNLCIQRITSIVYNKATIEAWANGYTFIGHFEFSGSGRVIGKTNNQTWVAGGTGHDFSGVAAGGGYSMIAWEGTASTGWHNIGDVFFSV